MKKRKVIFICTGNSCRSQIAEGLLRDQYNDKFEVYSAGSEPSKLHPAAIRVMEEWGVNISNQKSEHIRHYTDKDLDILITVCDNAKNNCPIFPNVEININWNIKDPFNGWSGAPEKLVPYRETRDELKKRIDELFESI